MTNHKFHNLAITSLFPTYLNPLDFVILNGLVRSILSIQCTVQRTVCTVQSHARCQILTFLEARGQRLRFPKLENRFLNTQKASVGHDRLSAAFAASIIPKLFRVTKAVLHQSGSRSHLYTFWLDKDARDPFSRSSRKTSKHNYNDAMQLQ